MIELELPLGLDKISNGYVCKKFTILVWLSL